jgi:hypothetical protein
MTDFIKNHKALSIFLAGVLIVLIGMVFARQQIRSFALDSIYSIKCAGKPFCTVNSKNATQILYKGTMYQILDETTDGTKIGGWIAGFRKLALVDESDHVIHQSKLDVDFDSQIKSVVKNLTSNEKYVVAFFNVYAIKKVNPRTAICVNLLNGNYKAVPLGAVSAEEKPIQYEQFAGEKVLSQLK